MYFTGIGDRTWGQQDLASLPKESVSNFYIAKIRPAEHSLLVPLGAKARLDLQHEILPGLPMGTYTVRITDISGAQWEQQIEKRS